MDTSRYRWTPPEIVDTAAEIPEPLYGVYATVLRQLPADGKTLVLRFPDKPTMIYGQKIIGIMAVNKLKLRLRTRRHEQADGA